MNSSIQKYEVSLKKNTNTVEWVPTFKIPDGNHFLVGFDKFSLSYKSGQDHHVRKMELRIEAKLDTSNNKITVSYSGNLYDDSKNNLDNGKLRFYIVAFDGYGAEEACGKITALKNFSLEFDKDHHVAGYGVSRFNTFMRDNSKHEAKCSAGFSDYEVPVSVMKQMQKENVHIICGFTMGMKSTDHHVAHTGVEISSSGSVNYDLSDKSGNHVEYSDAYVDCYMSADSTPFISKLAAISTTGSEKKVAGDCYLEHGTLSSHIQGAIKYGDYYVLSHNNKGCSKGILVVSDAKNGRYKEMNTDLANFNHPGGMQRYQNYMFESLEDSSASKSYVKMYNINGLSVDKMPELCEGFVLVRENAGAGAVGICKNTSRKCYMIAVYNSHGSDSSSGSNPAFDIYEIPYLKSDGSEIDLKNVTVGSPAYTIFKNCGDCQNIALVYDEVVSCVYIVVFRTNGDDLSYADYVDVYKVDSTQKSMNNILSLHMKTVHSKIDGIFGVHFRWGAGLDVGNNGDITLFSTERNFSGSKLSINTFTKRDM